MMIAVKSDTFQAIEEVSSAEFNNILVVRDRLKSIGYFKLQKVKRIVLSA